MKRIGIVGASGFVGREWVNEARAAGYEVVGFSRTPERRVEGCNEMRRLAPDGEIDLSGVDVVVNLAGESILGLWTEEKRRKILRSRVETTRAIVDAMGQQTPAVFVSASAIGFYGDTGDAEVDEDAASGAGFLAEVAEAWETEALIAEGLGVRVIRLRIGFVLGKGGAMKLIRPIFKSGLGGRLGSGKQWMSCIHVQDVARMGLHCVENERLSGAFNAVMPNPARNSEFTREVAASVHRNAFLPAPAFAIELALGDLSHLLLDSQRVVPTAARESGFVWRYPDLRSALS